MKRHLISDAEETVQKVFVALWGQRLQVVEEKSLPSYLYTIASYMIYQDFRQQGYKKAAFDHYVLNSFDLNEITKDDVLTVQTINQK